MADKKIPRVAWPADVRLDTLAEREGLPRSQCGANTEAPTIAHPGSRSHSRLTEDPRRAAVITQGLIRKAVDLEELRDLKTDLLRGLDTLQK